MNPTPKNFAATSFGAVGDGVALDTDAINRAIEAASAAGGGTVFFPAGTYLSFSIRLKSHVALHLDHGATILAADPIEHAGAYDLPEANEHDLYQDFGHSHWRNSLIHGSNLENIAITGTGLINGRGLTRRGPGARWKRGAGEHPTSMGSMKPVVGSPAELDARARAHMRGLGNKAIALKLCRNVALRDFSILMGGHFAVLATGTDNLAIDNLTVDTNRDGFDIDACRNVRIANCAVNTPNDDAIVLKCSRSLGYDRALENVTITNCHVSGYDAGSLLDGTFKRTQERAPDRDGVTGRIKLGTESNGGYRNITISNCIFDRSRGLALETVDGGVLEDVAVTNLTMRDITTAPLFLRIGNRARGPEGTPVGAIRRVVISNVVAHDCEGYFASSIAGLPGHPVEDVQLSNIRITYRGGGTKEDATRQPPENETGYPEPSMFGVLPASALFVRHAKNISVRDLDVSFLAKEERPSFVLHDVSGASFDRVRATCAEDAASFVLREVSDFAVRNTNGMVDARRETVTEETL